jgi:hypothetical protein
MGNRAHWAGCRILDALIGGPELALQYVQSLRPCAKDQWVDPLWADGGTVVDLDRRRVLFFGDELMVEMAERRALMSVLAQVWPDYAICWAYDGTALPINRTAPSVCRCGSGWQSRAASPG